MRVLCNCGYEMLHQPEEDKQELGMGELKYFWCSKCFSAVRIQE